MYRGRQHSYSIRVEVMKLYNLYVTSYPQFSKQYKLTAGADLGDALNMLRDRVNLALKSSTKYEILVEADTALENIKDIVWCLFEIRCISPGQLKLWADIIHTIGTMLGGWLKKCKTEMGSA